MNFAIMYDAESRKSLQTEDLIKVVGSNDCNAVIDELQKRELEFNIYALEEETELFGTLDDLFTDINSYEMCQWYIVRCAGNSEDDVYEKIMRKYERD